MATVKTTIEDRGLPIDKIINAAINAANITLNQVDKYFQDTCSTFNHKPIFHKEQASYSNNVVKATEWTNDENYVRLNYGTSNHAVGRGGQYMSFYPEYRRKTSPGRIKASTGGPLGKRQRAKGPWIVSGIAARNFDETIANHARPFLRRVLELELRKIG